MTLILFNAIFFHHECWNTNLKKLWIFYSLYRHLRLHLFINYCFTDVFINVNDIWMGVHMFSIQYVCNYIYAITIYTKPLYIIFSCYAITICVQFLCNYMQLQYIDSCYAITICAQLLYNYNMLTVVMQLQNMCTVVM